MASQMYKSQPETIVTSRGEGRADPVEMGKLDFLASLHTDVLVVGAGAAGLWTALTAADRGCRVALISRKTLAGTTSFRAQGGLAAACGPSDSVDSHIRDTLLAGRDACRRTAVEAVCRESPEQLADLIGRGIDFDRNESGKLQLGLEGGHSHRRIVHSRGSATGEMLTRELAHLVTIDDRIDLLENTTATGLLRQDDRCIGVVTANATVRAAATVMATGGHAALWKRTTNPPGAVGMGTALAYAAGTALADMEMMQFHPTALALPRGEVPLGLDGFLISEIVRGEGALLLNKAGDRFAEELAPRDTVAQAVIDCMKADGSDSVWLDMRAIAPDRFPNLVTTLAQAGIDPRVDLVPVSPAAHYSIGGIATDLDGRTSLPGLYAVGECSCTGLHGANRLASNSLSECFVFAGRVAAATAREPSPAGTAHAVVLEQERPTNRTRSRFWTLAGLQRSAGSLEELAGDAHALAGPIARSALARMESRGVHRRTDHLRTDPRLDWRHFVLRDDSLELQEWR